MSFQDHFSHHASVYASARPHYPRELFVWLASLCKSRDCVWDCATGNGQAAVALAEFFAQVIATDASAGQIAEAIAHPQVQYRSAPAEQSGLAAASVDLVTVAQALHWFDIPSFYREVERVLRPGGLLAVWSYGIHTVKPAVDAVVAELYEPVLGPYWPPERKLVERQYRDIAFPFAEITAPAFVMQLQWTYAQLEAYLYSWSATQRYMREQQRDPIAAIGAALRAAWGTQEQQTIVWPLTLRLGYHGVSPD